MREVASVCPCTSKKSLASFHGTVYNGRAFSPESSNLSQYNMQTMISCLRQLALTGTVTFGLLLARPAVAPAQTLYVSDAANNTVVKLTPGGTSTVFASTGLSYPTGLAFDTAGNLYVASEYGNSILKFTPSGMSTVFANAGLNAPNGLAFDAAGNLYAANSGDNTIVKFTPDGVGTVFASTGLSFPVGLAFDAAGNLYAANAGGDTIVKFTPEGVGTVFANAGLDGVNALAFDAAGNLYASNANSDTIEKFTPDGVGSQFASDASIPYGIGFDTSGNLYVVCSGETIEEYSPAGKYTGFFNDGLGNPTFLVVAPTPHPSFFNGEASLGNGVYYLAFVNGNYFGYYSFLTDPHYIYHQDMGYEYVFDAADGKSGVYLYDFKSSGFFYTSPTFPFPYLYDFSLNSVVYYYPDPDHPGRYNTDGYRFFYVFNTGKIISK